MNQDALFWNKVAAAVLTAGLIGMTAGFIADIVYHREAPAQLGFAIEVPDEAPAAAVDEAPAGPEPIAPLLASASVDNGVTVARRCQACHTFDEGGAQRTGPNLYDIVNARFAHIDAYNYSDALAGMDGEWTYEALNEFIYNPRGYVPGTKMNFAGIRSAQDRADLIVYLRSLSDSPAPLPEVEEEAVEAEEEPAAQE